MTPLLWGKSRKATPYLDALTANWSLLVANPGSFPRKIFLSFSVDLELVEVERDGSRVESK